MSVCFDIVGLELSAHSSIQFRLAYRNPTRTTLTTHTHDRDNRYSSQCIETLQISWHSNDPSAGSPTETLLRLLLPLNDQV